MSTEKFTSLEFQLQCLQPQINLCIVVNSNKLTILIQLYLLLKNK